MSKLSIFLNVVLVWILFSTLNYQSLVWLSNAVIVLLPIYAAPILVGKPEKCKDVIMVFFFAVVVFAFVVDPTTKMTKSEKDNLPCKGYIDPDMEKYFKYLPEYSNKCTSVFHAGHGRIVNGSHLLSYKGVEYYTKEMIGQYKQKKQYVFSCRGKQHPILDLVNFNVSFLFQEKAIEMQDDKEILWFAKEGTLLLALITLWVDFN